MSTLWVLSGCTSISSQLVHRDDSNLEWEKKRYKGVPITLKVPTHLKIAVTETHFLGRPDGTNLGVVEIPVPIRSVHYDLLYTERVFTVDFKRPGAGTMAPSGLRKKEGDAERLLFTSLFCT